MPVGKQSRGRHGQTSADGGRIHITQDRGHVLDPKSRRDGNGPTGFRDDLERIRFSPYYSRLSAVTQVVPQAGTGTVVHNRLTHTLKVSEVARSIAEFLLSGSRWSDLIATLGDCDPVVAQAAASAHDLGHPPFGHAGEHVLDRIARDRLGLPDGFEGNAQTFRILTALDTGYEAANGLNLTAAVRAAVLKYPWTRAEWQDTSTPIDLRPRGVGPTSDGAAKFSAYLIDAPEMLSVRTAFPQITLHQQTIECCVMDIADDIAYSVHDLDDFHRAGVLQHTSVSAEFNAWLSQSATLQHVSGPPSTGPLPPGHALERAWRRSKSKDNWIADKEAFRESVIRVREDLVDGLLSRPFDGGLDSERAVADFSHRWIGRLKGSLEASAKPHVRSGYVSLSVDAWHDVEILKFVHNRFVLERPDLSVHKRGQERILHTVIEGLSAWLDDSHEVAKAPRRLLDLIDKATSDYLALWRANPAALPQVDTKEELRTLGRARGLIDYVASFTDTQAVAVAALLTGNSENPWEHGRML